MICHKSIHKAVLGGRKCLDLTTRYHRSYVTIFACSLKNKYVNKYAALYNTMMPDSSLIFSGMAGVNEESTI